MNTLILFDVVVKSISSSTHLSSLILPFSNPVVNMSLKVLSPSSCIFTVILSFAGSHAKLAQWMNVWNKSLHRPATGRIISLLTVNVDVNTAPFALDFTRKKFP